VSNVLAVSEPKPWSSGDGVTYWVTLDDRTEDVPCYSDQAAALKIHEPLPEGWELGKSSKGKDKLTPPKSAGGGRSKWGQSSWYNSEEGVRFTQERTDRRTALMQAREWLSPVRPEANPDDVCLQADIFYMWLREFSGVAVATVSDNGEGRRAQLATDKPPTSEDSDLTSPSTSGGESEVFGEGAKDSPSAVHVHEWNPAPREGWALCLGCGVAEKASKVVMADA
jgi:hypothetical protein